MVAERERKVIFVARVMTPVGTFSLRRDTRLCTVTRTEADPPQTPRGRATLLVGVCGRWGAGGECEPLCLSSRKKYTHF